MIELSRNGNGIGRSNSTGAVWAALVTTLAAGYAYFVLLPNHVAITRLRQQLLEKQELVKRTPALAAALAESKERFAQSSGETQAWRNAAPKSHSLSPIYAKISEHAQSAGLQIVRFDPQPPINQNFLCRHGLNLTLEGDYSQLVQFIGKLEQLPQSIWAPKISCTHGTQSGKSLRCELTLTILGHLNENSN